MKASLQIIIDKAEEFLSDGQYLLKDDREEAAANRAYHAAFTAARALLPALDIEAKSHNGVQTQFSLHFIKTGLFDLKYKGIINTKEIIYLKTQQRNGKRCNT